MFYDTKGRIGAAFIAATLLYTPLLLSIAPQSPNVSRLLLIASFLFIAYTIYRFTMNFSPRTAFVTRLFATTISPGLAFYVSGIPMDFFTYVKGNESAWAGVGWNDFILGMTVGGTIMARGWAYLFSFIILTVFGYFWSKFSSAAHR